MKKVMPFLLIFILTGCGSPSAITSSNTDTSNQTIQNHNVIVKEPKRNEVTYEIYEKLVGKYVAENDPKIYFEIRDNGNAEIVLKNSDGYLKYPAEIIELTVYYSDITYQDLTDSEWDVSDIDVDAFPKTVTINFNLINGDYVFPENYGLSINFEGKFNDCKSFHSNVYYDEDDLIFVRQTDDYISQDNTKSSNTTAINQNIVVKDPKMNNITYEIMESLVGKYVVEDDPKMHFEIKPDGKATLVLNKQSGYLKISEEFLLTLYYSETKKYINFNLAVGYKHTFPGHNGLSVTFLGKPDGNEFLSTTFLAYAGLCFVKE